MPDPRLAQAQSLRDLASDWYELSVICKRIGAKIERAVKRILYEVINNSENNDDNPN